MNMDYFSVISKILSINIFVAIVGLVSSDISNVTTTQNATTTAPHMLDLFNRSTLPKVVANDCIACNLTTEKRQAAILKRLLYTLGLDETPQIPQSLLHLNKSNILEKFPTLTFDADDNNNVNTIMPTSSQYANTTTATVKQYKSDIGGSSERTPHESYDSSGWTLRGNYNSERAINNDDMATTEKVVVIADENPTTIINQFPSDIIDNGYIVFNISHRVSLYSVADAHLWLYIRQAKNIQEPYISLHIYEVKCGRPRTLLTSTTDSEQVHDNQTSSSDVTGNISDWVYMTAVPIRANTRSGEWIKVNLKPLTEEWLATPESNCGLYAYARDSQGFEYVVNTPKNDAENLLRPILEIIPARARQRRIRRYLGDCTEEAPAKHCCRYPLTINFNDFGWDFIIEPRRYNAYYCKGECGSHFVAEHAHALLFLQKNPQGSGGPCCTPTEMSSLQIIYIDKMGSIVQARIPNMVVKKCGCS